METWDEPGGLWFWLYLREELSHILTWSLVLFRRELYLHCFSFASINIKTEDKQCTVASCSSSVGLIKQSETSIPLCQAESSYEVTCFHFSSIKVQASSWQVKPLAPRCLQVCNSHVHHQHDSLAHLNHSCQELDREASPSPTISVAHAHHSTSSLQPCPACPSTSLGMIS